MAKTRAELDAMILDLIAHDPGPDERRFNALALELFAHQYERNAVYRGYCQRRGVSPATVGQWREIPAVPTAAFKETPIVSFDVQQAVRVFKTSGTTGSRPGKHFLDSLHLYEAAIRPNFAEHLLPDGARLPMLILTPSPEEAPASSLSYMMGVVGEQFASRYSYFVHGERLLSEALADAVEAHVQNESPVFLLGTAFAFVHWFDFCRQQGRTWQLPRGSRAMETGGYKGRSREVSRAELLELFETILGIPSTHVVNEYGMAELGTQFYDLNLKHTHLRREVPPGKHVPHWARTVVVDPDTLEELPPGRTGLLKHYDLVNRGSVMAILTDDLGVASGAGFEVLGRAALAEARGCSLALDQLLAGTRDAQLP